MIVGLLQAGVLILPFVDAISGNKDVVVVKI
jgi:hypothetical protein